jgi:hypothetical protein
MDTDRGVMILFHVMEVAPEPLRCRDVATRCLGLGPCRPRLLESSRSGGWIPTRVREQFHRGSIGARADEGSTTGSCGG